MRIITRRDLIKNIAKQWKQAFYHNDGDKWRYASTVQAELVYDKLQELDLKACSREEVDGVTGKEYWTEIICDECKKDVDVVIQVGENEDHDSRTANVCPECFGRAMSMMRKEQVKKLNRVCSELRRRKK